MNTWMNYTDTERKQMLERTSASIAEHFAIVQHRATYYNIHYVNYALLQPNTISILPPDHLLREYEQDYASMLESYIYGSAPSFAELMEAMEQLQNRIRNINNSQKRIKR